MGRKLEFSKDTALLQAMEGFWIHGYAATSMRDLAQRLNLHLGSVYNALGDKDAVFEHALRLYVEHKVTPRLATLTDSTAPAQALKTFIEEIAADCQSDSSSPGCFIINSLLTIGHINDKITAHVKDYLRMLESALAACIARAQAVGTVNTDEPPQQLARFIIASCKSMHVMKKIGANDDYISGLSDSLNRHVFQATAR